MTQFGTCIERKEKFVLTLKTTDEVLALRTFDETDMESSDCIEDVNLNMLDWSWLK